MRKVLWHLLSPSGPVNEELWNKGAAFWRYVLLKEWVGRGGIGYYGTLQN